MENFELHIELGNDAMSEPEDVALALARVTNLIRTGRHGGFIHDGNGNTVGEWKFNDA